MLRRAGAWLFGALTCAGLLAPPAALGGKAHRRSACQRLHGSTLARAGRVKLVRHAGKLQGCVLPRGKVQVLASGTDFKLRQLAGTSVLFDESTGNQYGDSTGTFVANLRAKHSYSVAYRCSELAPGFCLTPGTTTPGVTAPSAFVSPSGAAVAARVESVQNDSTTTISRFDPTGVRTDLDRGVSSDVPAASLTLTGSVISWKHSGAVRIAALPG